MTRRIMPASWMPRPSSVKATAPWATMSPISESVSPLRPWLQAPETCTRHLPTAVARAWTYSTPSRVVDHRRGVRHAADGREAALRGSAGAGGDVLLLLLARLAQVHVHVHEARDDDLAGQVALDALLDGEAGAHLDDLAVADDDVGHLVKADLRVDTRARS